MLPHRRTRLIWAMCLGWVVFACVKGYGGPINAILSWGGFAALARLTFFYYLIHFDIQQMFFNTMTYTFDYSIVLMVYALSFISSNSM